jgi:hypothetical protein
MKRTLKNHSVEMYGELDQDRIQCGGGGVCKHDNNISGYNRVRTDPGSHPDSYPVGTGGFFLWA